jgi:hypothetical protein
MRLTERQVKRVLHDKNYWTYVAGQVIERQQQKAIRRGDVSPGGYRVGDSAIAEVSSLSNLPVLQNRVSTRGEIREMSPFLGGGTNRGPTAKGSRHRHLPPDDLREDEVEVSVSLTPGKKVDRSEEDPDSDSQLDPGQDGYEEALLREAEWLRKQGLPSGPMAAAQSLWRREYERVMSRNTGRMRG